MRAVLWVCSPVIVGILSRIERHVELGREVLGQVIEHPIVDGTILPLLVAVLQRQVRLPSQRSGCHHESLEVVELLKNSKKPNEERK